VLGLFLLFRVSHIASYLPLEIGVACSFIFGALVGVRGARGCPGAHFESQQGICSLPNRRAGLTSLGPLSGSPGPIADYLVSLCRDIYTERRAVPSLLGSWARDVRGCGEDGNYINNLCPVV
jgi:hypothetical protein